MVIIEIVLKDKDLEIINAYKNLSAQEKFDAEEDYPDIHALAELFMDKFKEAENES